MIVISDCSKDIVIPAGLGDNAGVVYETAGVKSLNGETGDLKIKTVNGNDMLGDGNIEIQAGSDNVIVLDGLTQEERKAVYDKLDKTKAPDEVFVYEGKTSVKAWFEDNILRFITFENIYNGLKVNMYALSNEGNLNFEDRGMTYTNSVLMHLNSHVEESGYFECMYIGNFFEYILRPYTRPNACFINLEKGIGDSTRPIYAPVSTLVEKYGERNNVRMQFIANEKLYTFLLDPNQDNKWLFESAKPIGGVQSSEVSNIKVLTQAEYDALTTKDENVLYCIKG